MSMGAISKVLDGLVSAFLIFFVVGIALTSGEGLAVVLIMLPVFAFLGWLGTKIGSGTVWVLMIIALIVFCFVLGSK